MAIFDTLQKALDAQSNEITNLGAPSAATSATKVTATLADIKPVGGGLASLGANFTAAPSDHVHPDALSKTVRGKTTGNLSGYTASGTGVGKTLTAGANAAFTSDGISWALNDYVLVAHQTTGADNGIYKITTLGDGTHAAVLTRRVDFDEASEMVVGCVVTVTEGTSYQDSEWMFTTTGAITVDTTALTFRKTGGRVSVITLTDAATIAIDASLFCISGVPDIARVTITAARTLGNWTNPIDGQQIKFEITTSGGAFTPVGDTNYTFGTDITAFPSIASGKMTKLGIEYHGGLGKFHLNAYVGGF